MAEAATSKVLIDNARTRVSEWRFAPGAATGWHRHAYDYVVVPMLDGRLRLIGAGGETALPRFSRDELARYFASTL